MTRKNGQVKQLEQKVETLEQAIAINSALTARRQLATALGQSFSGKRDIYEEAGIKSSLGYLDARKGKTLIHTFQKALIHDADIIQIVTWNDFGEGTNIEPTEEYEYCYLEIIQNLRRKHIDPSFSYRPATNLPSTKPVYSQE